jgi:DNA primase
MNDPAGSAVFSSLPAEASDPKIYPRWEKRFSEALYRNRRLEIFNSKTYKLESMPGDSGRDFRIRLADVAREERDRQAQKLREKFSVQFERLDEKIRRAEQTVEREQDQVKGAKLQTAVSLGATLLSAFPGRKATSRTTIGRATTTARGVGRTSKQAGDVRRAKESLNTLVEKRRQLNERFEREIDQLEGRFDVEREERGTSVLKPRQTYIQVRLFVLAWLPYRQTPTGIHDPLWVEAA